jgi:hypothetical protein
MYEEQLYELARQRIDRKNRRWFLWGVNFLLFLMFIGAFVTFRGIPRDVGTFMALAWFGVLALHGITIGMTQNREQEIASEVAKLREAVEYEKPKRASNRVELIDDGELSESIELPNQRISRS